MQYLFVQHAMTLYLCCDGIFEAIISDKMLRVPCIGESCPLASGAERAGHHEIQIAHIFSYGSGPKEWKNHLFWFPSRSFSGSVLLLLTGHCV